MFTSWRRVQGKQNAQVECGRECQRVVISIALALFAFIATLAAATHRAPANEIVLEVFTRGDSEISTQATEYAHDLARRTPGLTVQVHDILKDRQQLSRLWKLTKSHGRDKPVVPAFYCCNRMYFGFTSVEATGPSVQDLYTVHVYTRDTCPRCQTAKAYFKQLGKDWPALRFQIYEVTGDAAARQRWYELCRSNGQLPGLPTTQFAGQVIVGYQGDQITGKQYRELIEHVSGRPAEAEAKPDSKASSQSSPPASGVLGVNRYGGSFPVSLVSMVQLPAADAVDDEEPNFDDVPLPDEATASDIGESTYSPELDVGGSESTATSDEQDRINVPWMGELRVSELGLPAFTLLVGLIDGFNPCAMWVLVFLLSVLVNIKDRKKILLIAGTFVVISGLAYYTFMAAWMNMFILVGLARPIQIALGVMAITIGAINVKDFFAFKKGFSLSIPESSKPGIYARVRAIVAAKYLTAALSGAVVLAILVNVVELLCTAGLPALYTQILTMQELPAWQNYSYLGLYILAYMLDDTILLTIVVTTLSHRKLQEREGRWLKLVSGLVILILGAVMIFKPEWLHT